MATTEDVYRESQERLHKTLGAYLLVKAWELKVDGVIIQRDSLLKFLKLTRMKNTRIDWLKEDLKDFFPYSWVTYSTNSGTYASLYLSRYHYPVKAKSGSMTDKARIDVMKEQGLKVSIVKMPTEKKIISSMALLSNGISTPVDFID